MKRLQRHVKDVRLADWTKQARVTLPERKISPHRVHANRCKMAIQQHECSHLDAARDEEMVEERESRYGGIEACSISCGRAEC